ncbi:MAG TPA: copper chaperone PCu(A)C [Patescibacteria group bacterium]|nr:copper chaperone PCu(A)C [Patescibacteria group bacterium]
MTARALATVALAGVLVSGGCVHYPTVMEAGGTMVRPDKGRAVRQGAGAVVYFDLKSSGKYGDVITAVHTPVARQAQLVSGSGEPLTRLEVPGTAVVSFTSTGPHVVLSELTRPLVLGDTIIVTLVLEKMGGLGVIATVE